MEILVSKSVFRSILNISKQMLRIDAILAVRTMLTACCFPVTLFQSEAIYLELVSLDPDFLQSPVALHFGDYATFIRGSEVVEILV